jgi:hypothetical protein
MLQTIRASACHSRVHELLEEERAIVVEEFLDPGLLRDFNVGRTRWSACSRSIASDLSGGG